MILDQFETIRFVSATKLGQVSQFRNAFPRAFGLLALILVLPATLNAALILQLNPQVDPLAPGSSAIFTGTITNTTGSPLQAVDLFLNFGGFNPTVISQIDQLLGNPDFALPNNTFKADVDLFRITLQANAPSGSYDIGVTLQDINDNLSDSVTAQFQVGASGTDVPEPGGFQLCLWTATAYAACRLRQWRLSRRAQPKEASSKGAN